MPDTILLLGPVVFRDFEVPERINFGGAQRLAVHHLTSGGRVIDTLGRDDADISFSGIFTGADAMARTRTLDEFRALGRVLTLTWDVLTYSVVIREFQASFTQPGWIPFRVCCTVLRDEAAALIEAPLSLVASVLGDGAIAGAAALAGGISLALATDALGKPDATRRASPAHTAAQRALADAQAALRAGEDAAGAALDPDALTKAATLPASVDALQRLALFAQARAHAGRAMANLANASN